MKAKEIMIGDWVAWQGHPYRMTANDISGIAECELNGAQTNISEIPITRDILKNNGFVFEDDMFALLTIDEQSYLQFYFFENRLRKYWSGVDEWKNHTAQRDVTFQCQCYYVHQLQHAIRLFGIDKEITL